MRDMKRIFLIGYMGAGKTTLGKVLAARLGLSFVDLDLFIESRYHRSVSQLFAEKGEAVFRRIEKTMLEEVGTFEDVLVSTGGGTPCFYNNMEYMNRMGQTIFLEVPVDELAARLELCKSTRPILRDKSGDQLRRFIGETLEIRQPYYDCAQIRFDAAKMITEQDVEALASKLVDIL